MNPVIPADFEYHEIEMPDGTLEFWGKLLGVVDNERRGRPRWAEIELWQYAITESEDPHYGEFAYLLHTMGHSVVYHRHEAPCNKGVTVPVEDFPERAEFPNDLEPCEDTIVRGNVVTRGCYPDDWRAAAPGTLYDLEVLRHTRVFCPTARDAVDQLRRPSKKSCAACGARGVIGPDREQCGVCHGRGYTAGDPILTAPGQRLVEMVKFKDPEIARAVNRIVKL